MSEDYEKQSSFTRSLYASGGDTNDAGNTTTNTTKNTTTSSTAYPMPKSRPEALVNRRSSRRLSIRKSIECAQQAQKEIADKLSAFDTTNSDTSRHDHDDDWDGENSISSFADVEPKRQIPKNPDLLKKSLAGPAATEPYETSMDNLQTDFSQLKTTTTTSSPITPVTTTTSTKTTNDRGGRPMPTKQNSWYQDALRQGDGNLEHLNFLLGDDAAAAAAAAFDNNNDSHHGETHAAAAAAASIHSNNASNSSGWDDDEVLEQYRLMAQHEANLRVKENTGFDMHQYEKRKKMQGESKEKGQDDAGKGLYYSGQGKLKQNLPPPKRIGTLTNNDNGNNTASASIPSSSEPPTPMEPPPPPFNPIKRIIIQKSKRIPELCPGEIFNATHGSTNDHDHDQQEGQLKDDCHIVICLGCHEKLQINRLATLVSCPGCQTVSPASSTRGH